MAALLVEVDKRKQVGLPVYNFATGNPILEPTQPVLDAMETLLGQLKSGAADAAGMFRYTTPGGSVQFRNAIARLVSSWQGVNVSAECVVAASGAQSALVSLLGTLLQPGEAVLLQRPCYPDYLDMVSFWNADYCMADCDPATFELDMTSFERCLEKAGGRLRCVLLCSPGNPTGKLISASTLHRVAQLLKVHRAKFGKNVWLVCDSTYWRLAFNAQVASCFELYEDSIVVSSFSKDISLAGERLGFAVVNPQSGRRGQVVARMEATNVRLGNLSPPAFMQHVVCHALQQEGGLPSLAEVYRPRVERLRELLLDAGMQSCHMPDAAFYLFPRLPDGLCDAEFCARCSERGVFAMPGSRFECPGHVRFAALPDMPDIEEGAALVRSVLQAMHTTPGPRGVAPPAVAPLPLELLRWDHYTLICKDAERVARAHCELLGFQQVRVQNVNSGTVPDEEVDMCNYILRPPSPEDADRVLVVTEGLNERTIFRKYLAKFGPGIHHVAYQVADVDEAFRIIRAAGYKTTSEHVMHDMLSGLKQFFIVPEYTGFFIELIERTDREPELAEELGGGPLFTSGNMAGLAASIADHVSADPPRWASTASVDSEHPRSEMGLGAIRRLRVRSEDPAIATEFLCKVLGFRFLRADEESEGTKGCGFVRHFHLPREPRHVVSVRQALDGEQPGVYCVDFGAPDVGHAVVAAEAAGHHMSPCSQRLCPLCARVPHEPRDPCAAAMLASTRHSLSYCAGVVSELSGAELSRPVWASRGAEAGLALHVLAPPESVVAFLADARNLSQWTGHKGIHRLAEGEFGEVRCGQDGRLARQTIKITVTPEDAELRAEHDQATTIAVSWEPLGQTVQLEVSGARGCGARVAVGLPRGVSALRRAELLGLLQAELSILKALLEGNEDRCVGPSEWQRCDLYHLKLLGAAAPPPAAPLPDELRTAGFRGECLGGAAAEPAPAEFSCDFALVRRAAPLAVLRPGDAADVAAVVRLAAQRGLRVGARGGRVSHCAGGQALANGGLLLDMSSLCSVDFDDQGRFVDVGGGASWHEVIRLSVQRGLAPPVVTDWQYLSVGGTISMGGFGFMSHREGLQAGRVCELDVVTGTGALVTCHADASPDLFRAVRGGLGHFGVMARVRIPLQPAPRAIRILRMFYLQEDLDLFLSDCDVLADRGVDLIHSFMKPRTAAAVVKALGPEGASAYARAPEAFRAAVEARPAGASGSSDLLFYLEVGLYEEDAAREAGAAAGLRPLAGFVAADTADFMGYVTRDPPVIEINKQRGPVPHPSIALTLGRSAARSFLELYLGSERGEAELTEVLITPLWRPSSGPSGHAVPMLPLPEASGDERFFFVLVLGTVAPASAEGLATALSRNLKLHTHALGELGAKRYPYDTVEVEGQSAWAAHFGKQMWGEILECKQKYDPLHLFSPGVKMFG